MAHGAAAALLATGVCLAACTTSLQTTSGADYLARYDDTAFASACGPSDVDKDVRQIASIEPNLLFPARIGIARISRGQLTAVPETEARVWEAATEDMGSLYGTFVPVSPLIAEMVSAPAAEGMSRAASTVANIRRGAARQHLDYVLIYEVGSSSRDKSNALALADLTIIGMFVLPSRDLEVTASASGLLVDVRNGYPYATLTTHAEKTGVSRVVSQWSRKTELGENAEAIAVANLAGEFETALKQLGDVYLEEKDAGAS